MRQILVFTLMALLVPLAFFMPFTGLVSYISIAYTRPHEWAYMPGMQLSLAVAVATLLGYAIFELTRRAPQLLPNVLILLLWAQLALASYLAQSPELAQGKLNEFSKTFLIALLITAMVDSEKRARWLLLGIVFSVGMLAFRSNIGIVLTLGQARIYGPGGAFEDNNDYALLLNIAAPLAIYLARGETNRRLRWLCYTIAVMMIITVPFTLSRGGFLGLCMVMLGLAWKSKYKITGLVAVLIAGSITFALLPQHVTQRVGTISTASATDESAQMRFDSWRVSGQIIGDHPFFGVGPRNMLQVYDRYSQSENIRMAHNSFLQMGVDGGAPALLFLVSLIGLSLWRLWRSRRILQERAPDSPVIWYTHGLELALLAYLVSGQFLSRNDLELLYQICALATSFRLLARNAEREAETQQLVARRVPALTPELAVR
jgi:probable O-glycosylation ligase (exosortase A-associated)